MGLDKNRTESLSIVGEKNRNMSEMSKEPNLCLVALNAHIFGYFNDISNTND